MPLNNDEHRRDTTFAIQRRRSALYVAANAVLHYAAEVLGLEKPQPRPMHTSILSGQIWLDEVLSGHPDRCRRELGMSALEFALLWAELVALGGLAESRYVTAQEQLAIFVYWMVHGSSQRELQERFQHSGDTISRYLNKGLELFTGAFLDKYVHEPVNQTPARIRENPRWYPFFKYCRGAVDGVHFLAYVLEQHIARYRDRHGTITQNCIAACDFEMLFVFLMAGYEGTAADGLLFAQARRNGFSLPEGCYYLADAGFPNCDMLLAPYRGVRYHLKEWKRGNQRPQTPQELFNLRHAQLRNVIERIFGVSKRQFRVLISRPEMGYRQQALMVGAAAALHNFLRIHEPINNLDEDDEYDIEGHPFLAGAGTNTDDEVEVFAVDAAEKTRADARRDRIAQAMWNEYILDHPDLQ
ncbi:putative nuclease HARBI1-like protein [Mycena venus]|uniref:Putative nuclease HARBI1-like protein n=1 Tax=Mycena venus TaxID=2733690 RepID=A0A8H6XV38_9AGAR|nr:putative nuclease HARBI1-like protein [Mycena venus]